MTERPGRPHEPDDPADLTVDAVDPVDPRFRLANERTLLAWLRTTLGLLAGSVAVASPVSDLSETTRVGLGILLVCSAAVTMAIGWQRYRAVDDALTTGGPLPESGSVRWVGLAVAITIVAVAISILAETLI
jgi:putative membrane protein